MSKQALPRPGLVMIPSSAKRDLENLCAEYGVSGASRKLDIAVGTIRRVREEDQARPSTVFMLVHQLREIKERLEKSAPPAPDSR